MKVFISADMEGLTGVSAREEVDKSQPDYAFGSAQMTAEVAAATAASFAAGAAEVYVRDAHWTARNLDTARLNAPEGKTLRLIRGWSGHPFSMVQGLDASFSALVFIGYHSAASRGGNPLAHTLSSRILAQVRINERIASEFLIYSYAAALVKVPVIFLAGDEALCREALAVNPTLQTVATFEGFGPSIVSLPPREAVRRIEEGVRQALQESKGSVLAPPGRCQVELEFRDPAEAYRKSFYPGASLKDDRTIAFQTAEYFDVLRLLKFMTV